MKGGPLEEQPADLVLEASVRRTGCTGGCLAPREARQGRYKVQQIGGAAQGSVGNEYVYVNEGGEP